MSGLTVLEIENLPAKDTPYRVFDKGRTPGLCIQVSTGGKKTFYLTYRIEGKARFFRLGSFPGTGLSEARTLAGNARKLVEKKKDPQVEQRRELAAEKAREARRQKQGTVEDLFKYYVLNLESRGKRSVNQVRRVLNADIKPVIGDLNASEIQPDDIRAVLAPIKRRGALVLANRVRAYLSAAFNYGIEWKDQNEFTSGVNFDIVMNPVSSVKKPLRQEAAGQRTLSEDEVKALWVVAGGKPKRAKKKGTAEDERVYMPQPTGRVLRLILATGGQRVEEVLRATWDEFDMKASLWELPPERTKKDRAHVVPLSQLAIDELKALRKATKSPTYLFPAGRGADGPIRTDSLGYCIRRFCADSKFEKFTARDLRRTVKTLMGKAGLSKSIRDRLQNHKLSDTSSKHYDRYDYLAEKREAIAVWESMLTAMIEGKKPKVVKLSKTA
jgi:integrase